MFSREFVELPDAEKRKRLAADVQHKYETAGPPRKTPQELETTLQEWHQVRAKEVKYLNSGNRKALPGIQGGRPRRPPPHPGRP